MRYEYTDGSNPDFSLLCQELDAFLNGLVGGEQNRLQYIPLDAPADIDSAILAYDEGLPVACVSFKRYDEECAEVKRLFVREEYRGKGISKKLMELLENLAKTKGFQCLILETGAPLVASMGLYSGIGFRVIPNYGPYKKWQGASESICMKKEL